MTITWEDALLKSQQDPAWRARFMEADLVRKAELTRNFTTQEAGRQVRVGSRMEVVYNIMSKAPVIHAWPTN
jgi:hypothetical protein